MNNLDKRQQELFEAPSVSDQVQRLSKMAQMGYGEYWRTSKPVETAASSFKGLQGDYPGSKQTQIDNHAFGQAYVQQYRLPGIPEPEAPKNESTSLLSRVVDLTSLTGRRAMSTGKALAQGAVNADEGFERAIAGGIKAFADSNNDDIRKAVTDAFRASLSGEEKERLTAELSEKYKEELAPKTAVGKIKDFVGLSDDAIDLDIQARWDRYVQAIRRGEAEAPELSTGAQAFDAIAGHELLKKMEAWENSTDLSQHTPEANAQKEQLTGFNSKQEFLSYDLADRMAGWAKDAKDRMEGNPYEFGSPEYFAFTFGGSAPQMLAAAGTGAITRNPYLAAGMIAAPVFGDTYAEGREKGLSADDAFAYATATAISEFLPQATVFKYLDKAGGGFLKKVLKGTIAEGAEEVVTEAMQMGLDLGFIGEDDSGLEWWQRLVTAGVVGGIGGATFGAAYAAADAYSAENVDRVHRDQIDREIQGYTQQARQILDNYQNNPEAPRTIESPARQPTQTNTSTPPVSASTPQPAQPAQSSQPAQLAPLKEFTQEDINYISANISIDDANKISGIQAALARGGAEQYIVDSLTSQLEQLNLRYATIPTRNESLSSTSPDNQISGALTQDEIDRVRHSLRTRIGKVAERLNITDTLPDGTPLTQEGVMLPDGQVYINPAAIQEYRVGDNLIMDRDQRIEFVAWHELRHAAEQHLSSRPFGAAKLDEVLNTARQNKVVDTLAKAIMAERQAAADSTGFDAIRVNERMATQEALAELSAAIRTGNYKAITARYRDFYPPKNASGIRKLVKDVGDTIRRIVGKITNKKLTEKTLPNEDAIYAMLDVENQFYNTPPSSSNGVAAEVQSPVSRAPQILPRVSGVLYSMRPDTVWWDILNGDQPVPANWSGGDTQSMLQTIWHPYATKRQVEKFIQMHSGREDWFRSLVQIRPGFNKFNQYLVEQGIVTPEEARLDKPLVGSHYITLKNLRNIFTKFGGHAPSISVAVQMNNSDTHLGFGEVRLFLNRDKFDEYGAVAFDYYTPVIESLWAQDPQLAKKIEEGEELSKAEVDRVNAAMVSLGNSPTYDLVRKLNSKLYPDLRKAVYGDDLTGPVYTGVISGLVDKFNKLDILYERPIGSENDGATIPLSKETLESFIEYIDAGKLSPKFSNVLKKVGIPTEMVEGVFREVLNDASSHKPAFGEFKAEEVIDFREDIAAVIAPEDIAQEVKEFFDPIGVPVYSHGKGRSYSDTYNSVMAERGDSILYSSKPISSYSQPGTDQAEKLPSWRTVLSNIQRYRDQIPEVITPEMTREMLRVIYGPNVNQLQVEAFIELTSGNPEFLKYLATEFRTGPNLLNQYLVQSGIVTPEEAQLVGEAEQIVQRPLMAVHNTTVDSLRKITSDLENGQPWTASVAVLPVFRDYTRYGNISLVIKPETVRNNLSTLHFDDVETTNSSTEAFAKFPEAQEYLTDIQNWVDSQKGISDLESFRNQQYENPVRRLSGIIAHLNGSPFIPNLEAPEMYVDSLRQLRDYLLSGTPMNEFLTDGLQRILPKLLKTSPYGELKAQLTWDDVQEVLVPSSILDQLPENIPVPVMYYDGLITQGEALRRRVLESAALFSVPPGYTRVFDKQTIETGRENYYDELKNPDVYIPDSYIEEIFSGGDIIGVEQLLKRRDLPVGLLADITNKLSTNEFSRSRVAAIIEYLRKTGKFNAAAPLLDDVILGKTVRYVDDISSIKLILERSPGHITEILKSANLINSEKLQLKEYFRFVDVATLPSIIEDSNSFLAVELLPYLPEGASGSILNTPTLDGMLTTDTLPLNTFLKFKVEDIRETESQRTVLNTPEYRAAALEKYLKDPTEVARGYIQETISKLPQDQVVNLINDYSSTKAVISVANIIAKENSWEDGGLQVYDAVLDIYRRWASGVPNPPQVRVNVSDNLTLMKSLIERDGYENFNEHELSELIKSPKSSSDFKSETFKELVKRKVNVRTISNLFTYGHAEWNDVTKAAYNGVQRYRREMRPVMDVIENQENPTLQSVAKDLGWQKDRLEALLSKGVGKDQVASWRKNNGKIDRLQLLEAFGNAEYTVLGTFTRSGMQAIGGEDHAIIFDNPAVDWFSHSGIRSTITGSSHPPGFAFTLYHDFTDTDGKQAAVITEVQSDVMSLLYDERKFDRISNVDDEKAEALRVQAEPFKKTWPRAVMRNAMRHLFNSGYERIYALTHNGVKQLGANPPLSVINDTVGAKAAAEEGFGPAAQKQLGPHGEAYEVWSPIEKDSAAAQNILFSTAPKWERDATKETWSGKINAPRTHELDYYWDPYTPDADIEAFIHKHKDNKEFLRNLAMKVKPGFNRLNQHLIAYGIVTAEEADMVLPLLGSHTLTARSLVHLDKGFGGRAPAMSIALRRTDDNILQYGFGSIALVIPRTHIPETIMPFDFWSPSFATINSGLLEEATNVEDFHDLFISRLNNEAYSEIYEMGQLLYPDVRKAIYANGGIRESALSTLTTMFSNELNGEVVSPNSSVDPRFAEFGVQVATVDLVRAFNNYLRNGKIDTEDFRNQYTKDQLKKFFVGVENRLKGVTPQYAEAKSLDLISLQDIPAALVPRQDLATVKPILDKYKIETFVYDTRAVRPPPGKKPVTVQEAQQQLINKYKDVVLYSHAPSWDLQDVPTTRPGLARRLMTYVRSPEFADKWADRQGELERIMRADPRATPVRHAFKGYNARVQHQLEKEVEPRFHKLSDALVQYYNQVKDLPVYKALGSSQSQKVFLEHLDKIGKYVYHGRERNIEIAVRTGGEDFAGSGRNEAEIIEVENFFNAPERGSGQMLRIYEEIYRDHLKPLMDYSDQILRDTGLLTPEMEAARPKYQWYVPLYGKPELEDPSTNQNILDSYVSRGGGTQRDVLQNRHHTAGGRHGTEAHSLFETVFTQAEISVRRAQMQEAKAALWDYLQSPRGQQLFDAKIHTVFGGPTQNASVDQQGQVTWANALSPGANDVVYQNGSELHVMAIGNPRALSAIKDFNKAVITNNIEKGMNWLTRFMGSMYTRFNPSFIVKNKFMDSLQQWQLLLADAPTGTQLSTSGLFGHLPAAANVASRVPLVMKAMAYNAVWTGTAGQTPDYRKWLDRYAELGGVTTYAKFLGHNQLRNLQQEFYEKSQGIVRFANPKNQLTALGKLADGINNVLELTTRVSAFRALVESGVDEVTAANYVKDIMNFETKGEFAIHANSIWPFFTSSMYDIRRIGKALTRKEGQVVFLALVGASYALWEMLAQVGGEDEDGIPWVDKYPMGIAARHFIVPIASDDGQQRGEGVRLPIGYGLGRLANSLALSMRRLANGTDDSGNFVSNVVNHSLIGSFSPLQPSDVSISNDPGMWMLNTFAPQVMKPIIQFGANKNWRGTPIYDSGVFRADGDLDYNSGFAWTPDTYKMISEKIYDATGGDIAPESLQFWVQTAIGGLGTDIVSMAEMVVDQQGLGNTTTASWYKAFPVLGGFIQTSPSEDRERYYTYRDRVSDQYNRLIDAAKRGKDITDYQTALQWDKQFEVVDKQLSKLRKQKKAARESLKGKELRATERRINAVEKMIQTNIIRQYEEQTGERK